MKTRISLLFIAIFFSACTFQPQSDIKYKKHRNIYNREKQVLDKNKSIISEDQYKRKNFKNYSSKNKTQLKNSSSIVRSYERVPLFYKKYKKELSLKGKKKKNFSVEGTKVKVSVESIPLNEFIDLVFGSVLKLNYTTSKDVKKMDNPVTLNMTESQDAPQFYKVVKKILNLNGVRVKEENGVFFLNKVDKNNDLSTQTDIYIGYGTSLPSNIDDMREVLQFVPYNYILPRRAAMVIKQAGIKNLKYFYLIKGIQTIKGKAEDVKNALKVISLLDRPFLDGKIPYLINLKNIDVKKFVQNMKNIFLLSGINIVKTPSKGGIVMLPIEELNSVYIITPKKEWLNMLLYWKNKLDIPAKTGEEPRLYIYHVKNRKADELANAVKTVLGAVSTIKKTGISNKKNLSKNGKKGISSKTMLLSRTNYTPTINADLNTNILMMRLTPRDYRVLLPFVEELDKLPLQTLVEVTVAEVDMTDNFSLGFEYALRNKGIQADDILTITGVSKGLGVVFNGSKIDATINAYAEKKLLNIISRPKILILNNTTGSINVGTQVPVIKSEVSATDIASSNTPTINRNITYRTTGIILSLTPTINSNGVLTMSISVNLSEAQTNDTSGIDSPLIVNRQLNTKAVINSGDTILIGGLISQNNSSGKTEVPLLKDIPIIGNLFVNKSHKNTKTELIMLIRPVIIKNKKQIDYETDRFKTLLNYIDIDEL